MRGFLRCATLGFLELSLARPSQGERYLAEAVAGAEAAGIENPRPLGWGFVFDYVEALLALGRLDDAELVLARYEERARALDGASALAACARCRGLVLADHGDLEGALAALELALEQHERAAGPFERARTLLVLGVVQRRGKRKAAARESLERALAVFEELGARLWADRTRAELGAIAPGSSPAPAL